MKTYSVKPADISRTWYIVDASTIPLGRLSTQIASLLLGKHKPQYSNHIDCGDYVIVINAENLVVTGNKREDKMYYNHSGFPGGLRERTLKDVIAKDPTEVVYKSVRGMLPVNKLRPARLQRLKIYNGSDHQHAAQQPVVFELKGGKE